MAWTTARTWITGEVVTKTILDQHVRDNLQFLHDRTRNLWVPVTQAFVGGVDIPLLARQVGATAARWPVAPLAAANDRASMVAKVPDDYGSIDTVHIMVIPKATQAAADWDLHIDQEGEGSTIGTSVKNDTTSTYNVTLNVLFAVSLVALFAAAPITGSASYLGVTLIQGTAGHNVDVLGFLLRYYPV